MQELVRRGELDKAENQLTQLGQAAHGAYADVREGILALRTSLGPGRTSIDALREYLAQWQQQSGVETRLDVERGPALDSLAPTAELQLLRIVQEALANVRKHAEASRVEVRITSGQDEVATIIADDGRGFSQVPAPNSQLPTPHFGLSTMRERAESVGGTLEVVSAPSAGTTSRYGSRRGCLRRSACS